MMEGDSFHTKATATFHCSSEPVFHPLHLLFLNWNKDPNVFLWSESKSIGKSYLICESKSTRVADACDCGGKVRCCGDGGDGNATSLAEAKGVRGSVENGDGK
ncbi:hypothetical protein U1Q18_004347 [Sarracenia purpurea var. burkii]